MFDTSSSFLSYQHARQLRLSFRQDSRLIGPWNRRRWSLKRSSALRGGPSKSTTKMKDPGGSERREGRNWRENSDNVWSLSPAPGRSPAVCMELGMEVAKPRVLSPQKHRHRRSQQLCFIQCTGYFDRTLLRSTRPPTSTRIAAAASKSSTGIS